MKASKEEKLDKRATALRDNLKRRKAKQSSEKEDAKPTAPATKDKG